MAGKVVLNKQELDIFIRDLVNYHNEIELGIKDVLNNMAKLNGNEDVFYMDKTSKNINNLLDTLSTEVMQPLGQIFEDTARCSFDLAVIMNGIDR